MIVGPRALPVSSPMTRLQADLLLLFAAAIWGFAFVFQKTAMASVGPFAFIAARSLVATFALAPLALLEVRGRRPRERGVEAVSRQPVALAVADVSPHASGISPLAYGVVPLVRIAAAGGVAFFVAAALQQWGLITATVTNASFLTALYVVIVPFLGWLAYRAPPTPVVWLAAGLSFLGIWLLGGGTLGGFAAGDGLVALSALFWAVHLLVTARASDIGLPVAFTCLQFAVVALLATLAAVATEVVTLAGLLAAWKEIAYVGLLSSALTFTLLALALRHAPPGEAAILVSTENLFAALAGALLLDERLPAIGWAGAGVIMAAILLVQWAVHRRDRVPAAACS